ncbi:hypothetical protein [Candidatus Avelusimicrobium stercoris]|uniref:hypothetical protein n=1 Tax=Candidatus Avelusimicrobium stercoris TaxID=1947924 RepID=UPI003D0F5783
MEQFLQMVAVLAALYIAYALTLKKWDYASEAKRTERRTQLKELGLSNTFYFIHAGTLFILNAASGGLFAVYWLFRQWKAVLVGFRRLSGQPLAGGAFVRTLGGAVTFFGLNAIICRTCEYMRKKSPLPPWVWGTLWLGGLIGTILVKPLFWRACCYALWVGAPAALQRRLNALPEQTLSAKPKPGELAFAIFGLVCVLGAAAAIRTFIR